MKFLLTAFSLFFYGTLQAQPPDELRFRQAQSMEGNRILAYLTIPENSPVPDNISEFPLTFILAGEELELKSLELFKDTGNPLSIMFIVDISRSMDEETFSLHREALLGWVKGLNDNDTISLLTVGDEAKLLQDFTTDHEALGRSIENLSPTDNSTHLHRGLKQAMERIRAPDLDLPTRRVIVVLSDGEDDAIGDVTFEEVRHSIKSLRVPIFAIGFYRTPLSALRKKSLKKLGEFSRLSGGKFVRVDGYVKESYVRLQEALDHTWIADLSCNECPSAGGNQDLKIKLSSTDQVMEDQITLKTKKLYTLLERLIYFLRKPVVFITCGVTLVILFIILLFIFKRKGHELQSDFEETEDKSDEVSQAQEEPKTQLLDEEKEQEESTGPQIRLVGVRGIDLDQTFSVGEALIIGRSKNQCGLSLIDDTEVSREHCELFIGENGNPILRDLNSSNGTFVNGVSIQSDYPLQINDIITIGRVEIRLVSLIIPSDEVEA